MFPNAARFVPPFLVFICFARRAPFSLFSKVWKFELPKANDIIYVVDFFLAKCVLGATQYWILCSPFTAWSICSSVYLLFFTVSWSSADSKWSQLSFQLLYSEFEAKNGLNAPLDASLANQNRVTVVTWYTNFKRGFIRIFLENGCFSPIVMLTLEKLRTKWSREI